MSIDQILMGIIQEQSKNDSVAVLLSAGVDSVSLAIAAHRLGKKITGYSLYINGEPSSDSLGAKDICETFGWDFVGVDVPITNLKQDFITLIDDYKCLKKTQVECTFPFLYVYPQIKEHDILSGVAADGWFGLSKKAMMHYREPKEKFDEFRTDYFNQTNPAGIKQQYMLAEQYGKNFIAPYVDDRVRDYMMQFDWYQINRPGEKRVVRNAFPEFKSIKAKHKHENLQLVAGVPKYFEKLLDDSELNVYNRNRVMDLVRDYVNRSPNLFEIMNEV